MRLYNDSQEGRIIAERLQIADTFWKRIARLLGRDEMLLDEGVLIMPAKTINTYFFSFPVDVLFLDREGRVVRLADNVMPWQTLHESGASSIVELSAGALCRRGCRVGDHVVWRD